MPGHVINRREQHKQHTRAALEDAALLLFGRQGYESTTVEEIADAAGVSVRTFFRYFSSKQHVLFGDVAFTRVSRLKAALDAQPAGEDPLESVRMVLDRSDITDTEELEQIRARMNLMIQQPQLLPTYLQINYELQRQVGAFVAARCGVAETDPYPLLVSAAAAAAWDVALSAWATGNGDLAALRRAAFSQLSAGITAPA